MFFQNTQENWNEYQHGYHQHMMAFANQHWNRPPFPGFDPQRAPPPGPFPFPGMYPPHPMYFQQNVPHQGADGSDDPRKGESPDAKDETKLDEKEKKDSDRRAKLKKIEESMKKREEEQKRMEHVEIMKKQNTDDDVGELHSMRSRNNSEASDSSRRSAANEAPLSRYRRQMSNHDPQLIVDVEGKLCFFNHR